MNFFTQIRESVIDFKFYRSIRNNKFSRSFLYLLLLFLIIYFINGIRTFIVTRIVIDKIGVNFIENVPEFRLENGELSFEGNMPYYISNSTNEIFVIDTTGSVKESVLKDVRTGMLITRNNIYIKTNEIETRTFSLTELKGIILTKSDILEFLPKLSWIMLIFIVFGFIFALGWKLLNAVILALLGLIVNSVLKGRLKFNNMLNISIYVLTLPMLIQLAVNLYGYPLPGFGLIYWGISILYAALAVKSCRDEENESDLANDTEQL
ncbi:MAG TPA: DUF1189 domain-containing protein [Bacillota bacterium]|nr:DUF1189 domain-containing protein [Bacillota bacterium]HPL52552.1 DUF1189 domain-containing protein [Bacillota bacterium]